MYSQNVAKKCNTLSTVHKRHTQTDYRDTHTELLSQ